MLSSQINFPKISLNDFPQGKFNLIISLNIQKRGMSSSPFSLCPKSVKKCSVRRKMAVGLNHYAN